VDWQLVKTASSSRPAPAGLCRPWRRTARATVRGRAVFASGFAGAAGFTLTEILVAIVLIVLVGGLAIANVFNLANGINKQPPRKVLEAAIREARFDAMQNFGTVYLTYDSANLTFDILDDQNNILDQLDSNADPDTGNLTVTFARILPLKDTSSDYKSTMDNPDVEDKPSNVMAIHGTGVSAPMQVDITEGSIDTKFYLDAFSEGPPPAPPPPDDVILNNSK
jgi:Tfp pilus assembly protein FimT